MPLILRSPDEVATKLSITIFGQAASNALYKTYSGEVVRIGESALAANMAATLGNLTNAQFATTILTNTGLAGNAALQSALEALLGAGAPRGQLALNLGRVLDTLTADVTFGAAAKAWVATQDAAFGYSSSANSNQSISISALGVVAGSVTLTASVDKVSGTIFNALRGFTPGGTDQVNTLNDDDELTGTDGTADTLKFTFVNDADTSDYDIQPVLTKIENVEVSFATDGDPFGVASLDLQDADAAVDTISISRIDSDLTIASVNNLIDGVSTINISNSNAPSTLVEVLYTANATATNGQSVALNLSNVQTAGVRVESDGDGNPGTVVGAVAGNGIETIAITSAGSNANRVGVLIAEDTETITIAGAQSLTLAGSAPTVRAATGVGASIVEATAITAGLANVAGSLKTINAGAMTGGLTLALGAEIASGEDGTSGTSIRMTVTGGSGDDRFILAEGAVVGGASTNTDIIDGGAGNNTLVIVGAGASVAAATAANVRKVQNLEIRAGHDAGVAADTPSIDADAFDALVNTTVRNEGQDAGISAAESMTATLIDLTAAQANAITIEHGTTGNSSLANNTLNVRFKTAGTANATTVTIVDNVNADPVFNFQLNARSAELTTIVDSDTESNSVYLSNSFDAAALQRTQAGSTLTVLPGTGSDAGRTMNFDTFRGRSAAAANGDLDGYGHATNGATGSNTTTTAAALNFDSPAGRVFYGTVGDQAVDSADRHDFENITASTYEGNVEIRLGDVTRADGFSSMSITGGSGNDTFIFDAIAVTSAGFTSADTVAGGTGSDTLVIDGNTATIAGTPRIDHQTSEWDNLTGIDVLRFGNNAGVANVGNTNNVAFTAGAYYAAIDNEFIRQTDAGNRLRIVNNDGDLSVNSESDLVLDLRGLAQNLWVTFVGANGLGIADISSNRLVLDDTSANQNMVLAGGDTDVLNTVGGNTNNNVLEIRNKANVSIADQSQMSDFSRIEFTNDETNPQTLTYFVNNTVLDALVDSSSTASVTAPEVLTIFAYNNKDVTNSFSGLNIDARTLTGWRSLNVNAYGQDAAGAPLSSSGTIPAIPGTSINNINDVVSLNGNVGGAGSQILLGNGVAAGDRLNMFGTADSFTFTDVGSDNGSAVVATAGVLQTTHTIGGVEYVDLSLANFRQSLVSGAAVGAPLDAATGFTFIGGAGADTLEGGTSPDTLTGGAGADSLIGGLGDDTFNVLTGSTGRTVATADTIADFLTTADKIEFGGAAGTAANFLEADGTAIATFAAFVTAADAALNGTVRYYLAYNFNNTGVAYMVYDRDGNGTFDGTDTLVVLQGANFAAAGGLVAGDII